MWKEKVKEYISNKQRLELLDDIKKYKKLDYEELAKEKFEKKQYFEELNLEEIRLKFKISSKVVPTVRSHFNNKYKGKGRRCPSCVQPPIFSSLEETSEPLNVSSRLEDDFPVSLSNPLTEEPSDSICHLVYDCPTFADQRRHKNMENDVDLCRFFKEIIQYRIENLQD